MTVKMHRLSFLTLQNMPPTNAGFDHMLQKSYIPVCYLV